ncbi:hypothetical protein FAVG1_00298 [Fusarium avenaceum]|nr:hypothetical protein FAVG1_00298 [Fusarium avenaceum]
MPNIPFMPPINTKISPALEVAPLIDEVNRRIDALRTPAPKNIQPTRQGDPNSSLPARKRPRNESPSQACDNTSDNVAISKSSFDDMADRVCRLENADAARNIISERLMERIESLEVKNLTLKQKVASSISIILCASPSTVPLFLCIPGRIPNTMVEKYVNKPGQWLYSGGGYTSSNDKSEAYCCPCVVYGRARSLLDDAVEYRNGNCHAQEGPASKAPFYSIISGYCCSFAFFCVPFYAGFIASLRGEVRQFYDIEGTSDQDYCKSCLNPCKTLVQIETEIGQRQSRRRHSECCGYKPEPPMTSSSSSSSRSHSKTHTADSEADESLPCIPEDSPEATPTTLSAVSSRRSSTKPRERSIARDPLAPTDATLVHSHNLAQDPMGPTYRTSGNHKLRQDTFAPTYPPSIHQLRTDTKAPASPPAVHQHDLFEDASETYPAQPSGHDIDFDPVKTFRASPEHQLRQDKMTPGAFPTSHNLHRDPVSRRARSPRPHTLEVDE